VSPGSTDRILSLGNAQFPFYPCHIALRMCLLCVDTSLEGRKWQPDTSFSFLIAPFVKYLELSTFSADLQTICIFRSLLQKDTLSVNFHSLNKKDTIIDNIDLIIFVVASNRTKLNTKKSSLSLYLSLAISSVRSLRKLSWTHHPEFL